MTKDERIGLIIVRELERNLKPENIGRLLWIARQREIIEKGADIYVSATLIALLGYSYDTLQDMATNEQHQEDIKKGKILQTLSAKPLEETKDAD